MPATKPTISAATPAGEKRKRESASFLSPAPDAEKTATGAPHKRPTAPPPKRVPPMDLKRPRSAYLIWKAEPENKGKVPGVLKAQWKEYGFRQAKEAAEEAATLEWRTMAIRLMEWYVDTVRACERETEEPCPSHAEAEARVSRVRQWTDQLRTTNKKCFTFDMLYKLDCPPDYPKYPALYNRFEAMEEAAARALAKAVAGRDSLQANAAGHAAAGLEQQLLRAVEASRGITSAETAEAQTELTAALAAASTWRKDFPKPMHHAGLSKAVNEGQAERSRLDSLVAADESARQATKDDDALIKQLLQAATAEELRDHAVAHRGGKESIALLEDENTSLRARIALLEEAALRSAVQNSHAANSLLSDIARAIEGQLVYTGPRLKKHAVPVSFSTSGVSSAVFAQAFGVAVGCISTSKHAIYLGVQNKGLRYGSVLALTGPVAVRLTPSGGLTATGSYKLF